MMNCKNCKNCKINNQPLVLIAVSHQLINGDRWTKYECQKCDYNVTARNMIHAPLIAPEIKQENDELIKKYIKILKEKSDIETYGFLIRALL